MRRGWLDRELARQIYEVTTLFTNNTDKLSTVLLVGGTDVATDLERCANGCSIIIGTPGRVHDILRRQDGPPTKNLEVCSRCVVKSPDVVGVSSHLRCATSRCWFSTRRTHCWTLASTTLLTRSLASYPSNVALASSLQPRFVATLHTRGLCVVIMMKS